MPFKKRMPCRICAHMPDYMIACGLEGCEGKEERKYLSVRLDMHAHCKEKCLCTTAGCYPMGQDND